MNVHDIVKYYIESNSYEGLYCDDCSCEKDDLFPCGENNVSMCEPGYKFPCPGEDNCDLGGGCKFHIGKCST